MTMLKNHDTPGERPAETLGSRFRNARTSQGKSLAEAARITCINPTTLANLEADNFTKMPAEVFTRGFIKLYAQYLGLDTSEIIKLYSNQENLDPVHPAEQPYRRDVLTGTTMAHPLGWLNNPRVRIITILLIVLVGFYVLGAIFKVGQKHPDLTTPDHELANSLVDPTPQPPPGEAPATAEITGPAAIPGSGPTPLPEMQSGGATTSAPPAAPPQTPDGGAAPVGQPAAAAPAAPSAATPPEGGAERLVGVAANGR